VAIGLAGLLYAWAMIAARRRGRPWPVRHAVAFYVLGLGSYAWISCGFLGVYSSTLRWAFTTRIAALLMVVPVLVSLGRPAALARSAMTEQGAARLQKLFDSWPMRLTGNAVFEPVMTFALFMLFLTPIAAVVRLNPSWQAVVTCVIPAMGLLMVLPIIENTTAHTNLFVTFEFVLAFVALVLDAIPGVLIRINETVLDHAPPLTGLMPAWFPSALRDQQLSGDILWFLAEIIDVPVLILLLIRWNRIDRRDARQMDELSDEEMEALTQAHLHNRRIP
jgi:putative membrane protein